MAVRRSGRRYPSAKLTRLARRLLNASALCSIATVNTTGQAHINAAYFAWSDSFEIVWLSASQARHSRNLRKNASAAVVVYDSHQVWGNPDRGIMLFGSAIELSGNAAYEAKSVYARRFRRYERDVDTYRVYRLRPRRIKLFHEPELGGGVFVTVRNRAGALAWELTELYQ